MSSEVRGSRSNRKWLNKAPWIRAKHTNEVFEFKHVTQVMHNHSRDQDTHTGPAQGQSKTQPKHSALSTGCETQTDRRRRLSTSGLSPPTIISQPSVQPSMASTFNIACPACRQLGALTAVTGPSSPNAHKRRRAISPHRAGVRGDAPKPATAQVSKTTLAVDEERGLEPRTTPIHSKGGRS